MSRFIKIGEASKLLGVTPQTLRRWERDGHLAPDRKTEGNTRYYDLDRLLGIREVEADLTAGYARVSGHDQKEDLQRQAKLLSSFCASKGWTYEIVRDLGSGMSYLVGPEKVRLPREKFARF
ncbi:MAG: MerR family DNA-binding transcriptional regulator [Waddliaceae bacterium]